jgi:hypothetical protein
MVKCGVLFKVRTEFLNIIYTGFGFKGLISRSVQRSRIQILAAADPFNNFEQVIKKMCN